jgi:hypothetical protein
MADMARKGVSKGRGRGRPFLPADVNQARTQAVQEASASLPALRVQAKAEGRHPGWARAQAAEFARRRMHELGDKHPPSTEALLKRGLAQ